MDTPEEKKSKIIRTEDYVWVDVRSPAEYQQGHVPGAYSLPLFSNEERAEVGTIYAKSGKFAAIERGLEIVGPRLSRMLRQGKALSRKGKLMVYCWRGGMRSASVPLPETPISTLPPKGMSERSDTLHPPAVTREETY